MATDLLAEDDREEEFFPLRLPDRYEVIDGRIVEMAEMSVESGDIANTISFRLTEFGDRQAQGRGYGEILFKLPLPVDRNRRPDAAYVSYSRWPKNRRKPTTNAWNVLPELMVEVMSPSDLAEEIMEKLKEYFDSGVTRVWVVYPRFELVYVYESFTTVTILTRDQELVGEPFLPGFRLPIAELFPTGEEPPAQPA
jgi:Uma2 family endonuclease